MKDKEAKRNKMGSERENTVHSRVRVGQRKVRGDKKVYSKKVMFTCAVPK